jgi:hypothetical protein
MKTNLARKIEAKTHERRRYPQPPTPELAKTALSDVAVLDKRGSATGLYAKKATGIHGISDLKKHSGEVLVSCGKKLSAKKKDELSNRGVKVMHVRECSNGGGVHIVRGEAGERHTDYEPDGSRVVNYLVLNKIQAETLLRSDVRTLDPEKIWMSTMDLGLPAAMLAYGGY